MIEVWVITFFCMTPANADCKARDGKVWGISSGPFYNWSEEQCVEHAEGIAQSFYNEKKYVLEYRCSKTANWEPFMPHRRP